MNKSGVTIMKSIKCKLNGDPKVITTMLDYLHSGDNSIWKDSYPSFTTYCKVFIDSVIESYDHKAFLSCDQYSVDLDCDGSFYLTIEHWDE